MPPVAPGPPLRAIIVEDDAVMRVLLEELLRDRGHRVHAVPDAEAALAAFERKPADLLLVDWTLPGMDGVQLCRAIRRLPGGDDAMIVMITGRDTAEDQMAALDAGASDYVAKPFEPELLFTRILVAERHIHETMRRRAAEA